MGVVEWGYMIAELQSNEHEARQQEANRLSVETVFTPEQALELLMILHTPHLVRGFADLRARGVPYSAIVPSAKALSDSLLSRKDSK